MKFWIGLTLIIVGIVAGLYFGVWWAFIGGIVQVIEQIRAPELSAMVIAVGIAKIVFAGLIGWLSAIVFIIPGHFMMAD